MRTAVAGLTGASLAAGRGIGTLRKDVVGRFCGDVYLSLLVPYMQCWMGCHEVGHPFVWFFDDIHIDAVLVILLLMSI